MYINTTSRCWKRPMSSNSYRPHGSPLACRSKGKLEVEPCGWDEWLDNGLFQHREVVYMYTGLYYKESQHPDCATWLPIRIILHRVRIRIILQRVRTIRIMLQLSRSVLSKWSCDQDKETRGPELQRFLTLNGTVLVFCIHPKKPFNTKSKCN